MSTRFDELASKVRFQADEDFNGLIIAALREREVRIEIQSVPQAGLRGASDPEVLAFAARENRILVSHDRRTMPAHFAAFIQHAESAGVIIFSRKIGIGAAVDFMHLTWEASTASEWTNKLVSVPKTWRL